MTPRNCLTNKEIEALKDGETIQLSDTRRVSMEDDVFIVERYIGTSERKVWCVDNEFNNIGDVLDSI